jgi:hypothetical protein
MAARTTWGRNTGYVAAHRREIDYLFEQLHVNRGTAMIDLDSKPKVITFDCYGTLVQWYEVLLHEIGVVIPLTV